MNIAVSAAAIDTVVYPLAFAQESGDTKLIKLSLIDPFSDNPRRTADQATITDISYSLVEKGQIQNLVVRPRNGRYEVYVGYRRFAGFKMAAARGDITDDFLVRCDVRDCDDNEAFVIALTENIQRVNMSPLDECFGIQKAIADGASPKELSRALSLTARDIEARAAIAIMPAFVHELLSSEKRSLNWATRLVRLSSTQLTQVSDAITANENSYASVGQIEALAKSGKIPVSHALFDVAASKLPIDNDLFGGDSTFVESDAFWVLQNAAIEAKVTELEEAGHDKVTVIHASFQEWKYHPVDSAIGAEAVICVAADGFVSIHDKLMPISRDNVLHTEDDNDAAFFGVTPQPPADMTAAPAANDEPDLANLSITPPTGKGTAAALARWRRDSVAVEMIANPRLARRVELAAAFGDLRLPQVQKPAAIEIAPGCPQSITFDDYAAAFNEAADAAQKAETPFAYVCTLTDDEVETLVATATAIRLPNQKGRQIAFVSGAIATEIAVEAAVDYRQDFTPQEGFFEPFGLQDLRSLAASLLGGHDALQARNASRPDVVALLCQRFDDAKNDRITDPVLAQRLNEWVPEYF